MDTGSISGADQRNCGRARKLLGSPFQYSLTFDCGRLNCKEYQRSALPGGCWRFHLYHRPSVHPNEIDGSSELLNDIFTADQGSDHVMAVVGKRESLNAQRRTTCNKGRSQSSE